MEPTIALVEIVSIWRTIRIILSSLYGVRYFVQFHIGRLTEFHEIWFVDSFEAISIFNLAMSKCQTQSRHDLGRNSEWSRETYLIFEFYLLDLDMKFLNSTWKVFMKTLISLFPEKKQLFYFVTTLFSTASNPLEFQWKKMIYDCLNEYFVY